MIWWSDMTMPQMTGLVLVKKLKAVRSNIPIIICSGCTPPIGRSGRRRDGDCRLRDETHCDPGPLTDDLQGTGSSVRLGSISIILVNECKKDRPRPFSNGCCLRTMGGLFIGLLLDEPALLVHVIHIRRRRGLLFLLRLVRDHGLGRQHQA